MNKYKKIFIIPYFGKFPNYFQLFLNSCGYNESFNWLIFTDDKRDYKYPKNVRVIYTSFYEIKKYIQDKFDFEINLDRPYKLCDYKVTYGYVFQEYIKEYNFWGYCDLDLIFGDLDNFITDKILDNYDKLFIFGHATLYRNSEKINKLFMKEYIVNGISRKIYKKYFSSARVYGFDELYMKINGNIRINDIFEKEKIKIYKKNSAANIYGSKSFFKVIEDYDLINKIDIFEKKEDKDKLFIYENGKIKKYFIRDKKLESKEYMYIHLQLRKMKMDKGIENQKIYKIIPNKFEKLEKNIDLKNYYKIKRKRFNLQAIKIFIRYDFPKIIPSSIKKILKKIYKKINI